MLYILVPDGWAFQSGNNERQTKDCLVHQINKTQMPLQEIIQSCLQNWPRYKNCVTKAQPLFGETLEIFRKMPLIQQGTVLEYSPKNNGKLPSTDVKVLYKEFVKKNHLQLINPFHFLHNPAVVLSSERRSLLQDKAEDQKANRRHYGDSPSAT